MRWAALFLWLLSLPALPQDLGETRELIGSIGGRSALLHLYTTRLPDGGLRVTGDYLVLPTMQQRYLQGERSQQIGVTTLKEGTTPILYGRPATATLQGTWSGGAFKGGRFGPEGQQRERFDFSETFPAMDAYSAGVRCELAEGRYASTLAYAVENGRLKSLDWRSKVAPGDSPCTVGGPEHPLEQQAYGGGLRFAAGNCSVTLRDLGDYVRVTAENCAALCASQAYLEPVLVDRRGNCQLLRPQSR